ncbi:MAG: hypothetical protein KC940_12840 [Candidatus Omnitrophica bacterium]|nr:hypothetical protein [Candidatus Omnitrophota bacterium]
MKRSDIRLPIKRKSPWFLNGIALALLTSGIPAGAGYSQTTLTYENWAEGFFTQTCCTCHHSSRTGDERFGAPAEFNFDTLDLIRNQADDIRAVTLGDYRFMPPLGVTWPWDRDNLREWMDAGMPGGGDSLNPVEVDSNEISLHYQTSNYYFSQPLSDDKTATEEKNFNYRYMRIQRKSEQDTMVPVEHHIYIRKAEDGTVSIEGERWKDEAERITKVDYNPHLPILLQGGSYSAPDWSSPVQIHERRWEDNRTWKAPIEESTRTENWKVSVGSIERLDNGVMLPVNALKVIQTNLDTSKEVDWWFAKGLGLVRKESNDPGLGSQRIRNVQYNIVRDDDPLRDLPLIRSASTEWLPFVGPDYNPAEDRTENHRMDYSYQFDFQQIGVFDSTVSMAPTATLEPLSEDPTATPILPTPTATPVGFGRPSEGEITAPIMTPTRTTGEGQGGTYPADDPRISNLMADDDIVDQKDLLIFLQHWHRSVK